MTESTIVKHLETYFDTNADISITSMNRLYNTFDAVVIEGEEVVFVGGTFTSLDVNVEYAY